MPRFEPAPCPKLQGVEWLADASCGYLVMPEDRSRPNGRTIRLMVAKHPARSPEKRPDPVVYLVGVNELIAADFIRDRDILVVSQRGTTKTVLVFVGRSKSRASWRAYSGGISLKA